jgi:hypothetical protein
MEAVSFLRGPFEIGRKGEKWRCKSDVMWRKRKVKDFVPVDF